MEEFRGPEELEFGGYVEPPSHLNKKATKVGDFPAELRTVPDYDYSLFRYSKLALPFLLLIMITAAVLAGLTFWQGPWGFERGENGLQGGTPRDFALEDADTEGGLDEELRNLRIAQFVIGFFGLLIAVFGIRLNPKPALLRILLIVAAVLFIAVFVLAIISGILGIDQLYRAQECADWTMPSNNFKPVEAALRPCESREQLAVTGIVADWFLAFMALFAAVAMLFTIGKKTWAWGPGRISVQKSVLKPTIDYPPPSPFMHVHETRRLIVWVLLFLVACALLIDFVVAMLLHENRSAVLQVDSRGLRTEQSGWPVRNNRFRAALSVFIFGVAALMLVDLIASKRRWIAYTLAVLFVFGAIGCIIMFAMDIDDINDADDLPCPPTINFGTGNLDIDCRQWQFGATAAVEFMLFIFVLVFIIYEFIIRVNVTLDTYYFYADSEWLRLNSLFVDTTDREAYDWKKFTMETGRFYYYSPTLGISTRTRPKNYVDPDMPTAMPMGGPMIVDGAGGPLVVG